MRGGQLPRAEGLRLWQMHFAGRSKFNNQPAIHCDGIPQSIQRVKGQMIQDEIRDLDCWLVACEIMLCFPPHRRQPGGHVTTASTGGYASFRFPRVNAAKPQRPRQHRHTCMLAVSPVGIDTPTPQFVWEYILPKIVLADWKKSLNNPATTTGCHESFYYKRKCTLSDKICILILNGFCIAEFFYFRKQNFLSTQKKILSLSKLENFFQKLLVNLTNNYKEMANNFFSIIVFFLVKCTTITKHDVYCN